jgi:glycolate oxidase FAD binding subunit
MVTAATLPELKAALCEHDQVRLRGSGSGESFQASDEGTPLRVALAGIVEFHPQDQVVVARSNTSVVELQAALAEAGQCLPWLPPGVKDLGQAEGTLAGQLSLNLPHSLEAACGTWRDWLLGLRLLLSDGVEAKTGSQAVKNVAGYDVQRLLIGARGRLAVITEVILRTFPLRALPEPDFEGDDPAKHKLGWVQRVLPEHFEAASEAEDILARHPQTATLYRTENKNRFPNDWLIGWGHATDNLEPEDAVQARFSARAKALFDPNRKLK